MVLIKIFPGNNLHFLFFNLHQQFSADIICSPYWSLLHMFKSKKRCHIFVEYVSDILPNKDMPYCILLHIYNRSSR